MKKTLLLNNLTRVLLTTFFTVAGPNLALGSLPGKFITERGNENHLSVSYTEIGSQGQAVVRAQVTGALYSENAENTLYVKLIWVDGGAESKDYVNSQYKKQLDPSLPSLRGMGVSYSLMKQFLRSAQHVEHVYGEMAYTNYRVFFERLRKILGLPQKSESDEGHDDIAQAIEERTIKSPAFDPQGLYVEALKATPFVKTLNKLGYTQIKLSGGMKLENHPRGGKSYANPSVTMSRPKASGPDVSHIKKLPTIEEVIGSELTAKAFQAALEHYKFTPDPIGYSQEDILAYAAKNGITHRWINEKIIFQGPQN